jgi:hypothetical protein
MIKTGKISYSSLPRDSKAVSIMVIFKKYPRNSRDATELKNSTARSINSTLEFTNIEILDVNDGKSHRLYISVIIPKLVNRASISDQLSTNIDKEMMRNASTLSDSGILNGHITLLNTEIQKLLVRYTGSYSLEPLFIKVYSPGGMASENKNRDWNLINADKTFTFYENGKTMNYSIDV